MMTTVLSTRFSFAFAACSEFLYSLSYYSHFLFSHSSPTERKRDRENEKKRKDGNPRARLCVCKDKAEAEEEEKEGSVGEVPTTSLWCQASWIEFEKIYMSAQARKERKRTRKAIYNRNAT